MSRTRTRKPSYGAGLNLKHSLLRGLQIATTFQDRSGRDVSGKDHSQHSNTAPNDFVVDNKTGIALRGNDGEINTGVIYNSALGDMTGVSGITVAAIIRQRATSLTDRNFITKFRSGFGSWRMYKSRSNASNVLGFEVRDQTGETQGADISYGSSENGKWILAVGVYDGNEKTIRFYFDGVQKSVSFYANVSTVIDRDYQIDIFGARTSISESNFDVAAIFGFHRALSATEVKQWDENWWQIFVPKKQFALTNSNANIETTTVLITDVNVTDSWIDGDTGLIITGSGFV